MIGGLPPGISELACHPAREIDVDTVYAGERILELAALCDAQVLAEPAAARVELWSFHDVRRRTGSAP